MHGFFFLFYFQVYAQWFQQSCVQSLCVFLQRIQTPSKKSTYSAEFILYVLFEMSNTHDCYTVSARYAMYICIELLHIQHSTITVKWCIDFIEFYIFNRRVNIIYIKSQLHSSSGIDSIYISPSLTHCSHCSDKFYAKDKN